jgi:hypothetical protein
MAIVARPANANPRYSNNNDRGSRSVPMGRTRGLMIHDAMDWAINVQPAINFGNESNPEQRE